MSLSVTVVVPILLLVIASTGLWVYVDARAKSARGTPIVSSIANFTVDTPEAWFVGCVVLWILFLPLYLTERGQ